MRPPQNVVHLNILESSRRLNIQAGRGLGRHRTYESGNVPNLPPGMWVVGPAGLARHLSPEKIKGVACGLSLSLWRLAVKDSRGKILDIGQPLSKDTRDANGVPLGELGAKKSKQKGSPPYRPAFDYATRGLTASQAVFLINAMRIASSLRKPLEIYLPGSEYRIWANEYGTRLGVDANAILDAHFEVLGSQITRLRKKLFPHVDVKISDTTSLLTEERPPFEGHWTRAVSKSGMGRKLLEIAKRDDAASSHIFQTTRKNAGLFLVQSHATGIINDSRPYNPETDGLHLVVSSAPVAYLKRGVESLRRKHGAKKVNRVLRETIETGADTGHPAAEFYLGAKIGPLHDPQGLVFQGYKHALRGVKALEDSASLQDLLKRLSRMVS